MKRTTSKGFLQQLDYYWTYDKSTIFIIALISVMTIVMVVGVYYNVTAERFSLKKSNWTCTETQVRNVMKTIMIGDKVSTVPSTESVCVEYRRH